MTRLKKEHILISGAELERKSRCLEEKERIRRGLQEPQVTPCLFKYLPFVLKVIKVGGPCTGSRN